MPIQIDILNVGDGDAIFITLEKSNKKLLMVIDGGRKVRSPEVLEKLKEKCNALNVDAPDVIICTHYDSDHIGGLDAIVDHYGRKIKRVGLHYTPKILRNKALQEVQNGEASTKLEFCVLRNHLMTFDTYCENRDCLYESLQQSVDLYKKITKLGIERFDPYAGVEVFPGWNEIGVLSPSEPFYDSQLKENAFTDFFAGELKGLLNESHQPRFLDNPCTVLGRDPDTKPTNLVSVIIRIDIDGKRFLFPGDAGISSFESIPNYRQELANVFFLKVPHHGSARSINSELINLMSPQVAYISGAGHQNPNVIACLKDRNILVRSTNDGDDLHWPEH